MDADDTRPDRPDPASLDGNAELSDLRRRVVSAVRRTCPGWLAVEAEDIVQNVIAQRHLLRFRFGRRGFAL
jgi:hypothetical protein